MLTLDDLPKGWVVIPTSVPNAVVLVERRIQRALPEYARICADARGEPGEIAYYTGGRQWVAHLKAPESTLPELIHILITMVITGEADRLLYGSADAYPR